MMEQTIEVATTLKTKPAKVEPAKVEPKKLTVTPVFGPMHHPYMKIQIEGETFVPEIDSWLQSQIDAGKLTASC